MRTLIAVFLLMTAPAAAQYDGPDWFDPPGPDRIYLPNYCPTAMFSFHVERGLAGDDLINACHAWFDRARAQRVEREQAVEELLEIIIDSVGPVE